MLTRAAHILALADELRRHALDCGHDLNAANLFAHRVLMRALAGEADIEQVAREWRAMAERFGEGEGAFAKPEVRAA